MREEGKHRKGPGRPRTGGTLRDQLRGRFLAVPGGHPWRRRGTAQGGAKREAIGGGGVEG
jgi:hypothetical protein